MATPIVPQVVADQAVLQRVSINYNPVWDGVNWVLTPTEISVAGAGILDNAGVGLPIQNASITIPASDLPAAGQTALQDLYGYIEEQMAALYT
jgi:hypothetical protein